MIGAALGLLLLPGCRPSSAGEAKGAESAVSRSGALFEDVAERAGIRFTHSSGAAGKFHFIENTPAGCAFVDYDNDGFLDIVMVQSGFSTPTAGLPRPHCALYRNQGDGTFIDATAGSGLDSDLGHGQGVAAGDYDNDGFADLFITAYGKNHLLRNTLGDGIRKTENGKRKLESVRRPPSAVQLDDPIPETRDPKPVFEDFTVKVGLDRIHGSGYATSAAFGDYDNDGRLDLYVCYYARWTWEADKPCRDSAGRPEYCTPELYEPETHRLYRNDGSRFTDISAKAGITNVSGRGLSVAFVDYNEDGKQDIFVANDLTPNILWRNNGNGTFTDAALEAGCAYDASGALLAGMGIGIADYDHSGHESLFVGNFSDKPNTLYKNTGTGTFRDVSIASGLAIPHMKFLTFGCEFMDYDADGWLDLINANGHVQVNADLRMEKITYKERKQLFHNEQNGRFSEIADSGQLGDLGVATVSRGLATGDVENDGRVDVLVSNQNGPAQLFRNDDRSGNHWISFLTIGTKSNRDGRHTRFVVTAGGVRQTATVRAGSSYLSHSDRRVYFGLGPHSQADRVEIQWPSGIRETLLNVAAGAVHVVTEGRGVAGKLPSANRKSSSTSEG